MKAICFTPENEADDLAVVIGSNQSIDSSNYSSIKQLKSERDDKPRSPILYLLIYVNVRYLRSSNTQAVFLTPKLFNVKFLVEQRHVRCLAL